MTDRSECSPAPRAWRWMTSAALCGAIMLVSATASAQFINPSPNPNPFPTTPPPGNVDMRAHTTFAFGEDTPLEVPRSYASVQIGRSNDTSITNLYDNITIEMGYQCSSTHPCTGDPVMRVDLFEVGNPERWPESFVADDDVSDTLYLVGDTRQLHRATVSFRATRKRSSLIGQMPPYHYWIKVFAYDENYAGQTNIAIRRNGLVIAELYDVRFDAKLVRMKWRQGDYLTHTTHHERISYEQACDALTGTWDYEAERCYGASTPHGQFNYYHNIHAYSPGGHTNFGGLCTFAGQALGRERLSKNGVSDFTHGCEYTRPESEIMAVEVFTDYTKMWTENPICGLFEAMGHYGCRDYPPQIQAHYLPSDAGIVDPFWRRYQFDTTGASDEQMLVLSFDSWDTAFLANQETLPARLYKEGQAYTGAGFDDQDADGVSDQLEGVLGLDPADPDFDDDGILDGLELWGTYQLPLHALGASPKRRDLVVEFDHQSTQPHMMPREAFYTARAMEEAGWNVITVTDEFSLIDPAGTQRVISRGVNPNINNDLYDNWKRHGYICHAGDDARTLLEDLPDHIGHREAGKICKERYDGGKRMGKKCHELGKRCIDAQGQPRWCRGQQCLMHYSAAADDLHSDYPFVRRMVWFEGVCGSADTGNRFAHGGDNCIDDRALTFLHELGHLMGLGHGGVDANDRWLGSAHKPNYWSVMSYGITLPLMNGDGQGNTIATTHHPMRLFSDVETNYVLDETHLDEPMGMNAGNSYIIRHYDARQDTSAMGTGVGPRDLDMREVDWNLDGDTLDAGLKLDIDRSGCHYWEEDRVWATKESVGGNPTKGDPCTPQTSSIIAPKSDLRYLREVSLHPDARERQMQRDLLDADGRAASELVATWPAPSTTVSTQQPLVAPNDAPIFDCEDMTP